MVNKTYIFFIYGSFDLGNRSGKTGTFSNNDGLKTIRAISFHFNSCNSEFVIQKYNQQLNVHLRKAVNLIIRPRLFKHWIGLSTE